MSASEPYKVTVTCGFCGTEMPRASDPDAEPHYCFSMEGGEVTWYPISTEVAT